MIAYVTPEILRWARNRAQLSVDSLAQKAHVPRQKIADWEEGKHRPTMRQAQHIAGALHIPFGYLFLSKPPHEEMPLPDFRAGSGATAATSPDLLDLLNDVIVKQQWYREFLLDEHEGSLKFVGRAKTSDSPEDIAGDIRKTIGLTPLEQGGFEDFFKHIVRLCESARILVMKSGIVGGNPHRKLSPHEFRGFSISDNIAPLVFVNGADAKAAQIFTLAHELAHIWLGASGVSNERIEDLSPDNTVERLCNAVAAELLVPQKTFTWNDRGDLDSNVEKLSKQFRVSRLVIIRRAYDLGKIDQTTFSERYKAFESNYIKQEEQTESGGNFYPTLFVRNSHRFTTTVMDALGEGKTLYREAAQLLNVKVPTLKKVAEHLELQRS